MPELDLGPVSWDRVIEAVEDVRKRLYRATSALEQAQIPYAVIGGNAVVAWVSRIDKSAARITLDVDLLLRPEDFQRAKTALEAAGFIYRRAAGVDMFLDGPGARARDAVHIIFSGKKVRPEYLLPAPRVDESERTADYQLLNLDALVQMKLVSFRDKDRTHLRDLIGVGLLDASWLPQLPNELADRLQQLLDTPEG